LKNQQLTPEQMGQLKSKSEIREECQLSEKEKLSPYIYF
jgi:hypothetical protein